MNQEDCPERIRLTEDYSRCVTDFAVRRERLKRSPLERNEAEARDTENARVEAEKAWTALEQHLAAHRCLEWYRPRGVLEKAAEAALDLIVVVDNDRRFVDVNEAAADALGVSRREIMGRRIEEFFSAARGQAIPQAWESFVAKGVQSGICELNTAGGSRKFAYRAKAEFAPGLHLSILREVSGDF